MLSKSIGTNIKHFRTEKGLSQDDLAAKLFVTRQTVSNYETGKSFPDIDSLQTIANELDVELTWLLYGKPVSPRKKADIKTTITVVSVLAAISLLTLLLNAYTSELRMNRLVIMPNVLVRLILVPLCSILLGAVLLQVIDCFLGIAKPKKAAKKLGRIITICILGINLILVLPYIIWCLAIIWQMIFGDGNVSAYFPSILIYEEVAMFFLRLMYTTPYVYSLVGMAVWLFYPSKRDRFSNK